MFGLCGGASSAVGPSDVNSKGKKMKFIDNLPKFTNAHKDIIDTTWKTIVDTVGIEGFGAAIFIAFFEIDPDSLQMFLFSDYEDVYNSQDFKKHVTVFAKHVGMFITVYRDEKKFIKMNQQLGRLHDSIFTLRSSYSKEDEKIHDNMTQHFKLSETAVTMALKKALGSGYSEEINAAWITFYQVICYYLMEEVDLCQPITATTSVST